MKATMLFIKSHEREKIALITFFQDSLWNVGNFEKSRTNRKQLRKKIRGTNSYQLH